MNIYGLMSNEWTGLLKISAQTDQSFTQNPVFKFDTFG